MLAEVIKKLILVNYVAIIHAFALYTFGSDASLKNFLKKHKAARRQTIAAFF